VFSGTTGAAHIWQPWVVCRIAFAMVAGARELRAAPATRKKSAAPSRVPGAARAGGPDNPIPARCLAEREGFEPPIRLPVCRISSAVLSTTQPPLRRGSVGGDPVVARYVTERPNPNKGAGNHARHMDSRRPMTGGWGDPKPPTTTGDAVGTFLMHRASNGSAQVDVTNGVITEVASTEAPIAQLS
jgi:hypothetical protein